MVTAHMTHSAGANVTDNSYKTTGRRYAYPVALATADISWVANANGKYRAALRRIPRAFAWQESADFFDNLEVLRQSVALRRLQSCFHHITLFERHLAESMEETFESLPLRGQLRFMTAPETSWCISLLRKYPSNSVMTLCTFLNGEAALHGLGAAKEGYCTALGDVYYARASRIEATPASTDRGSAAIHMFKSPCLVDDLPIDVFSTNVQHAEETSGSKEYVATIRYGKYSAEEVSIVVDKVRDAFSRVESLSATAAQLIRHFIKVIIPLKVPSGSGSTSQSRIPGRVLLSGVENASPAKLASALVHEAMHQLLYVLEWAGQFVIPPVDDEERPARVKSLWSGRELELHSFIHACFIWYGLVRFWTLPQASELFDPRDLQLELSRCLSGFRGPNPIDALGPFAGQLRYDVVATARTLHSLLESTGTTATA